MNKKKKNRKFFQPAFFPKNRKANLLPENVIFIILNILVLVILIGFIAEQGNGVIVLSQSYAKNIALLIDSAKPNTEIILNMGDAFDWAKKNGIPKEEIVKIEGNEVIVKIYLGGVYRYSFFNDVNVSVYPDISPNKNYIIKINGYASK
jgi:hypothetical protein